MSYLERSPYSLLRLIAMVCTLGIASAQADEYSDVNQLIRAEKLGEALVKADAYLVAKPRDPQMRFLKGVIQRISGKQAEAISTFTKLTEDFPELPEPYNNLAVLYAGQSQFEKARSALEMAIRTNPSYATAHENLGDVYARLASQAYGSALQLEGANAAVPPKLALIKEVFKPNIKTSTAATNAPANIATPAAPAKASSSTALPAAAMVPAAVVPSAMPAATPPAVQAKPTATDKASNEVEAAVLAWAKAWAAKDMSAYLGAYGKDFVPPGNQPRATWEQERKKRILGKSNITLKLENLTVTVNTNKATVKFRQVYKANALAVSSRKTLTLVKQGNEWQIIKESTGN
jgi:tetratricopeptide (TPR) repeat protein